jgi:hypothetical protein
LSCNFSGIATKREDVELSISNISLKALCKNVLIFKKLVKMVKPKKGPWVSMNQGKTFKMQDVIVSKKIAK